LTTRPLKSIGNLLFNSSAQSVRSSMPRSRVMSG
jgi:ATP-dependent protease ClpP protease subunit